MQRIVCTIKGNCNRNQRHLLKWKTKEIVQNNPTFCEMEKKILVGPWVVRVVMVNWVFRGK
jgi:hypothetical protein